MNDSHIEDLLCQKEELWPALIRSFQEPSDNETLVENIQLVSQFVVLYDLDTINDEILIYLMPIIHHLVKILCEENHNAASIPTNEISIIEGLKINLKRLSLVLEVAKDLLQYLSKYPTINVNQVQSFPNSFSNMLYTVFFHCKQNQHLYHEKFKEITDLTKLFGEVRSLQTIFFEIVENHLVFDTCNELDSLMLIELLEMISKIGETLSGMNAKTMIDNWKVFTRMSQKHQQFLNTNQTFNLGFSLQTLSYEIHQKTKAIVEEDMEDLKHVNILGFLVKVVQKLLDCFSQLVSNYFIEVINFFSELYNFPTSFYQKSFPPKVADAITDSLYANLSFFTEQLVCNLFHEIITIDLEKIRNKGGFFVFLNEAIEFALNNSINLDSTLLVPLIFKLIANCYTELICNFDHLFYDKIVANIAIITLLDPSKYPKIEIVLLQAVAQNNTFPALVAIDSWCLILKNSSNSTIRLTVKVMIKKMQDLNLGLFVETPGVIHLRLLTQRIFLLLPSELAIEELSVSSWKILDTKCIPISHRFYIEDFLNDLYERMTLLENNGGELAEMLGLVKTFVKRSEFQLESFETVSSGKLKKLEVNFHRFAPILHRFWKFESIDLRKNVFYQLFFLYLTKVTLAMSDALTGEIFLKILSNLNQMEIGGDSFHKILICDLLRIISRRNLSNFPEKFTLLCQISDTCGNFLVDKNPIIVEVVLGIMLEFFENKNYRETIANRIVNKHLIVRQLFNNYTQRKLAQNKFNYDYIDSMKGEQFRHACLESSAPLDANDQFGKFKCVESNAADEDPSDIIANLRSDVNKLRRSKKTLTPGQIKELNAILNLIDRLVNSY